MATAIEMQQLAEAGPRLAATPMATARMMLGHQAGRLQRLFHEGVAELHAVLPAGELMEMPNVEPLARHTLSRPLTAHLGQASLGGPSDPPSA